MRSADKLANKTRYALRTRLHAAHLLHSFSFAPHIVVQRIDASCLRAGCKACCGAAVIRRLRRPAAARCLHAGTAIDASGTITSDLMWNIAGSQVSCRRELGCTGTVDISNATIGLIAMARCSSQLPTSLQCIDRPC
jgi:hypothetical protein